MGDPRDTALGSGTVPRCKVIPLVTAGIGPFPYPLFPLDFSVLNFEI